MTNSPPRDDGFNETLFEFMNACPAPTAADVEAWCAKHPADAEEIRECARMLDTLDPDEEGQEDQEAIDPTLSAIARRVDARISALLPPQPERRSLPEIITEKGRTLPALAKDLGIDRGILADIAYGRLIPPVGPRLVDALSKALGTLAAVVRDAIAQSFDAPLAGHASSGGSEGAGARSWKQSVEASTMDDERKRYWLGQD